MPRFQYVKQLINIMSSIKDNIYRLFCKIYMTCNGKIKISFIKSLFPVFLIGKKEKFIHSVIIYKNNILCNNTISGKYRNLFFYKNIFKHTNQLSDVQAYFCKLIDNKFVLNNINTKLYIEIFRIKYNNTVTGKNNIMISEKYKYEGTLKFKEIII